MATTFRFPTSRSVASSRRRSEIVGSAGRVPGHRDGAVTPQSSLVTGYDFLADSGNQVATRLDAIVPGASDELITNANVSPGVVSDGTTTEQLLRHPHLDGD